MPGTMAGANEIGNVFQIDKGAGRVVKDFVLFSFCGSSTSVLAGRLVGREGFSSSGFRMKFRVINSPWERVRASVLAALVSFTDFDPTGLYPHLAVLGCGYSSFCKQQ